MDKISENSMLNELIDKPLLLWFLLYCISVFGVFFKYYFNLKDSFWGTIVIYVLFLVILLMFGFFELKSQRNIFNDDNLNWESRKYLLDYSHDFYYKDKNIIYIKFFCYIDIYISNWNRCWFFG